MPVSVTPLNGDAAYVTVSAAQADQALAALLGTTLLVSTSGLAGTWAPAVVLKFDSTNWNTKQTVYVKSVDDNVPEGDRSVIISHSILGIGSADVRALTGSQVANVKVLVLDDDKPALRIVQDPAASPTIIEGRASTNYSYTVALTKPPAADETVTVTLSADPRLGFQVTNNGVTTTTNTLTFTSANWNIAQTVTVNGINNSTTQNVLTTNIVHKITSVETGTGTPAADAVYTNTPVNSEAGHVGGQAAR